MAITRCSIHGLNGIAQCHDNLYDTFKKKDFCSIKKHEYHLEFFGLVFEIFYLENEKIPWIKENMDEEYFERNFSDTRNIKVLCMGCFNDYVKDKRIEIIIHNYNIKHHRPYTDLSLSDT